jgi:hypothetical protein
MSSLNIVQIENSTDLVRDMNSKAILSTDAVGLGRYRAQRKKALDQKKEHLETKQRLETIEAEMQSLKRIVSELSVLRSKG